MFYTSTNIVITSTNAYKRSHAHQEKGLVSHSQTLPLLRNTAEERMAGSSVRNPLAGYRHSASFNVEAMRSLLYGEDSIRFKHHIWRTLASDPLFRPPATALTLDQKRQLTFQRVKRLVEYNFMPTEELFEHPMRDMVLTTALFAYDPALMASYRLHFPVSTSGRRVPCVCVCART